MSRSNELNANIQEPKGPRDNITVLEEVGLHSYGIGMAGDPCILNLPMLDLARDWDVYHLKIAPERTNAIKSSILR